MEHVEGVAVERKKKLSAWDSHRGGKLQLPPGYYLGLDADLMELRGADRSLAVVFSVRGATPSEVSRAAEEDYRARPAPDGGPTVRASSPQGPEHPA